MMIVVVTVIVMLMVMIVMFVVMIAASVSFVVSVFGFILRHYGHSVLYRVDYLLHSAADIFLLCMYLELKSREREEYLVKAGLFVQLILDLRRAVSAVQTFKYEFVFHSITSLAK